MLNNKTMFQLPDRQACPVFPFLLIYLIVKVYCHTIKPESLQVYFTFCLKAGTQRIAILNSGVQFSGKAHIFRQ